jgi:RNA polymerase sigma-70 factor (ECF subfamily)
MRSEMNSQDDQYREASATYGAALGRIARAYELDADKRKDLLQEMHLALWRSFERFEGRCALLTWVYRVAHHTATSYVIRERRAKLKDLVTLEEIDSAPDPKDHRRDSEHRLALERLLELIHRLKPIDRQVMLLYLEDMDTNSIAEITGLSSGSIRTQIHRIKAVLARRFHGVAQHD